MWVLGEVLQLDRALMLCEPDGYRGEWLLREIMAGGNFGHYARRMHQGLWQQVSASKLRRLRLMRFYFWEIFWLEVDCWKAKVGALPECIRRRSFSPDEADKRDTRK